MDILPGMLILAAYAAVAIGGMGILYKLGPILTPPGSGEDGED